MISYLLFRLDPTFRPVERAPKAGRPAREIEIERHRPSAERRSRSAGFFGAP